MKKLNAIRYCFAVIFALLLAACGSGSAPGPAPAAVKTISGVAATGAPIRGTVYLRDSSGKNLSVPIAADGSFSFDATGLTMPCVLLSVGAVGNSFSTLYSLAQAPGTANINPLSNLAFTLVSAGDPDRLASADPAKLIEAASSFRTTVAQLRDALKGTLSLFGAADIDFVADKYTANHSGLDLMFDLISLELTDSGASAGVRFVDKTTGVPLYSDLKDLLSRRITITPTTPPLTAGNVCVLPAAPRTFINEKVALSAVVIGGPDQEVSRSVTGADSGSISSDGVYTAPAKPGLYSVTASTRPRQTTAQIRQATIQVQVVSPYSTPNPFTFTDKTITQHEAAAGDTVLSDPVTVTGPSPDGWKVTLSDTGPKAADVIIDGKYYVTAVAPLPYLKPGQRLWIVQVPSPVVGGTSVTTVTVGDYSTTFTTTTVQ